MTLSYSLCKFSLSQWCNMHRFSHRTLLCLPCWIHWKLLSIRYKSFIYTYASSVDTQRWPLFLVLLIAISNATITNTSYVLCSWGGMMWSSCQAITGNKTHGFGNCEWYNHTQGKVQGEHWGQCALENGTFGSCIWANGTLTQCQWNTNKSTQQWAFCEWQDGIESLCHWTNHSWSNCSWFGAMDRLAYGSDMMSSNGYNNSWNGSSNMSSHSMMGEWGKCSFSNGQWAYCTYEEGQLKGCHYGYQMSIGTNTAHQSCIHSNNTATSCWLERGAWRNCTNTPLGDNSTRSNRTTQESWSLCSVSNGTWGFCNATDRNGACIWGDSMNTEGKVTNFCL